ncbi:hypothetical protein LINPERHAP2_LOCUS22755 [Linum perenne]
MSPFQLDDSRSCLLHDSVPQPDSNSSSVASTKLPILVAVNLSSFQSRQNRSLEVLHRCIHCRLWTRSQTDKAKSIERPGSSGPPRQSQIPKRGRTNPLPSVTPIKIEELKESSSSSSSPSSSSASYTKSLSPPPSPRMTDHLPPPGGDLPHYRKKLI